MSSPSLKDSSALDRFLKETVEGRNVPAIFIGATTADGEVYYNEGGERIFGEPEKGQVDENTSEYRRTHCRLRADDGSLANILHNKAHHVGMSLPILRIEMQARCAD